jgi:hypothetical protein
MQPTFNFVVAFADAKLPKSTLKVKCAGDSMVRDFLIPTSTTLKFVLYSQLKAYTIMMNPGAHQMLK